MPLPVSSTGPFRLVVSLKQEHVGREGFKGPERLWGAVRKGASHDTSQTDEEMGVVFASLLPCMYTSFIYLPITEPLF